VLSSFPQRPIKIPAYPAALKMAAESQAATAAVLSMFITTFDNLREAAKMKFSASARSPTAH